jgi:hypothetical protein
MITRVRSQSATDVMGKTAQTAQRDCNPEHNPIGESCVDDHRTVLSSPEARFTRLPVQQHPRRGMGPEAGTSGKQASQAFSWPMQPIAEAREGSSRHDLFKEAVEQDAGHAGGSGSGLDPANPHGR